MKRIMAVYDVDLSYAERFADFANQKEKVPFTVMAFTSLQRLKEYAKNTPIELLLVSELVSREEILEVGASQVMILVDGEVVEMKDAYPNVYKFQSTDSILREVMTYYCEQPEKEALRVLGCTSSIVGVYSPVNRCLKTSFSLTMGQLLARESKVLYINLEDYSGFSRLIPVEHKGDLSDLLYYYRQENYNFMRLNSVIYTWGSLDYIPPARYPEDLCQISAEEMIDLLERIARESAYDTIIVDFGQFGRKAAKTLEVCNVIYMPVKEDCVSVAKIEEFLEHLDAAGQSELKERIQKIKLPYHNSFGRRESYMDQLLWGELGDYVRQLLNGRKPVWTH